MAYKNTKALALGAVIFIVIFKIEIECLRLPSNHNNSRYQFDRVRRNVETCKFDKDYCTNNQHLILNLMKIIQS